MKIIIVYEVFNREYDNCILLKKALEKFGYDVRIVYKMNLLSIKPSNEKVIVFIPNCYDDENFKFYYYLTGQKNAIFINMQYEQILSDDEKNIEEHTPKDRASKIYNLCWGKGFYDFLASVGIDHSLAFVGGALHLDFLRQEFSDFWISKNAIADKYSLPNDKRWILFISSFAYANNELVNRASDRVYGKDNNLDFRELSSESRKGILNWFSKYLSNNEDVIIYRKHPMEKYDKTLLEMEERFKGKFFLISDYNIKQWIYVCDDILNWYSTSAVECVVAKKSFEILRPVPIGKESEVVLFKRARLINNYNDFEKKLHEQNSQISYPFNINLINMMYEIDETPSFAKIIENVQRIENESLFVEYVDDDYKRNRRRFLKSTHSKIKFSIKKVYQWLFKHLHIRLNIFNIRQKYDIEDWEFQAVLTEDKAKDSLIESIVNKYYEKR